MFEAALSDAGARLLRPARKGEPERPGACLFKPLRQVIESINETFKALSSTSNGHGGHTPQGVIVRVLQRILALTAAIWHNDPTGQPVRAHSWPTTTDLGIDHLGADHVINAREADPVAGILGLTGGAGADLAIECSGSAETPQQCAEVTKRGGKIVIVAFYPDRVTFDLTAVVRKDISIHTSRGEGGNNVKRAVALAAQGKLRGAEMVTHRFPLEDIGTAFRTLRDRAGDPVKVVILP